MVDFRKSWKNDIKHTPVFNIPNTSAPSSSLSSSKHPEQQQNLLYSRIQRQKDSDGNQMREGKLPSFFAD